ncbi:MAG: LacI family DNA-binding transcriptional regulator [Marinilabiliaceae bacterium]
MPAKEVTIYDIASALGVSAATVSRGLKDHPSISLETRTKIKSKAGEMGYRTNALASSLRTRRSQTLGVIVPRLNSNFMSSVLAGMEETASEAGFHLIIMQSFESKQKESENARLLFHQQVDGILVSTTAPSEDTSHFQSFFDRDIPVVFFDRPPASSAQFHTVTINNKEAAREMTNHLIKQGCKMIMHITGDNKISAYRERKEGHLSALHEKGIATDETLIRHSELNVEDGRKIANEILNMKDRPDAIFVANDTCALTIVHHLRGNGIDIPGEIQMAGFNNDAFSALMVPTLTTINYPGTRTGREAVKNILLQINGEVQGSSNIILEHELIIRQSTQHTDH